MIRLASRLSRRLRRIPALTIRCCAPRLAPVQQAASTVLRDGASRFGSYAPTVAMRRLLVAPGVPNGTPATTMMRSPSLAKPSI